LKFPFETSSGASDESTFSTKINRLWWHAGIFLKLSECVLFDLNNSQNHWNRRQYPF